MAPMGFILLIVGLACYIHTSTGASYTVTPSDTQSAVGATTRILCTVNIDKSIGDEVYWHFEPNSVNSGDIATIGPFKNRNPSAFPRLSITGDPDEHIYNLEITDTKKRDEGTYSCLIVKNSMTEQATATLTVADNNSPPDGRATCNDGNLMGMHPEGDTVTISCSITGGVPLPILKIVRDRQIGASDEEIPSSTELSMMGNVVTETAIFTMTHVDHNATYRCMALHPNRLEDDSFSCNFTPQPTVTFAPVVSIDPTDVYIEGDDDNRVVILICDVIANPAPNPVEWEYASNKLTTGTVEGNKLTFNGVSESYIGEDITCKTSNSEGEGTSSITLKEEDPLLPFETYILLIIIAGGCLLFFFLTCICIICCCQRNGSDDEDGEKNLGYHVNESRPTSMRQDNDDDVINGYDADNFSGGSEANLVRDESHKSRASNKSRASERSGVSENRSSVRSNGYNDVNTFQNEGYSPDEDFASPLY